MNAYERLLQKLLDLENALLEQQEKLKLQLKATETDLVDLRDEISALKERL